jgi:hypothetical protein
MKEEVEEVLFKAQISENTIVIIRVHVLMLQKIPGAQPILQKKPEEKFSLILT